MKTFIISDTHFGHKNILKLGRSSDMFSTVEEMDEHIIKQWNSVVGEDDLVYHLGDVFLCGAQRAEYIASRLNGRKILVLGNHDHFSRSKYLSLGFLPMKVAFHDGYVLTHKPLQYEPCMTGIKMGCFLGNIHGHTHGMSGHHDTEFPTRPEPEYLDVSAEVLDYTPTDVEEIIAYIEDYDYREMYKEILTNK